jgi:dihydropteroate synthase
LRTTDIGLQNRTAVMGVVNVTPDSFSDGGLYADRTAAIRHGQALFADGADIVDVGGESTRPGAAAVSAEDELERVQLVVAELAAIGPVSIDSSKAAVAAGAIASGAELVNDITALGDPEMADVVAASGAGLILMHMQGTPRTMQQDPHYDDVVSEVVAFLMERAATAEAAGVARARIAIDPGIGFGKDLGHNLELLASLERFVATGYAVVLGTSRKAFLGALTGAEVAADRDPATAATVALAVAAGVGVVRVHNVAMGLQAARTAAAIVRS